MSRYLSGGSSGLLSLLLVVLTVANCSKDNTWSTPDYQGVIQIVISAADETINDPTGHPKMLIDDSIVREDAGPTVAKPHEDRITLDQFNGDVFVRVYSQDLVQVVSQQLTCTEQGGTMDCSGTVSVPFGNYQVSVEAIDNNELQYFGIDTNVEVVEGVTAVATITMIDFTTSLAEINYLQTGTFTLTWSAIDSADSYLVEEDTVSTFVTPQEVYQGSDKSTTISETDSDIFYYRVSPERNSIATGRPGGSISVLVIQSADDHALSVGAGSGGRGSESNRVPVTVVNSDSTIAGFQFDLSYDSSMILPSTSGCGTATRVENIGGAVACNGEVAPGLARYVFYFYDGQGLNLLTPGVDPVFYVNFDVLDTASVGTTVTLRLQNVIISDASGLDITGQYQTNDGVFEVK